MKYNVGIIGGGQLGLMIIEECHKLGLTAIALDPDKDCPCANIADKFIEASYSDIDKLRELGKLSDVITYEFENIKSEYLEELNSKYNLKQGTKPLFDSQDRLREKDNANKHGLKTCKYLPCDNLNDLDIVLKEFKFPFIYKTRTLGYDGHGQEVIHSIEELNKLDKYFSSNTLGIVEEFIDFDFESSVVLVRDDTKCIAFPIGRNIHKDGILDITITPYIKNKELETNMINKSKEFMCRTDYKGILAIEYFVKGNDFYFNEMAPRPHNSGHFTIEGCNTNQFKELVNYLVGYPLEEPKLKSPTIMKNILGNDLIYVDKLKEIDGSYLHMYGKTIVRPKRKMGHITFTNMTYDKFIKCFKEISEEIKNG